MRQLLQEEFFNLYKKFEKTVKKLGDCAIIKTARLKM